MVEELTTQRQPERQALFSGIESHLASQPCAGFFHQGQNGIPRFLDSRLVIPGKVIRNSNNFTFSPVSDLRDVDIPFSDSVKVWIAWVFLGGADWPQSKTICFLSVTRPRAVTGLSPSSIISVLKGNIPRCSKEALPFKYIGNQRKPPNLSSPLILWDTFFALMTGTKGLKPNKTKLPWYTVSLERTCLFYKKKFSNLGIYAP